MTHTKTPPLALLKIPYLLWGIIEPLCFLRDLFSSVPNLQPIHVKRLTLLQTLFTFIIPRSRDVTLLKRYLWVMLLVNDLPWVVHLYLEGYYLNDWEHFADNIHVVSPLMRSDKPAGSVLQDDGTPMTDKEIFLQERVTAFVWGLVWCAFWFLLRFATVMGWFGKIGGRVVDEAKVGEDKSTDGTVFSRNGTAEDKEVYTLSLDKDKVMKGVTVKIEAI